MQKQAETSQAQAVLEKSMHGIKWTIPLSILSVPISLGTTVLLAWLSPKDPRALGAYGILQVAAQFVISFFLFGGGGSSFVNFLPRLKGGDRTRFLFSYAALAYVFGTVVYIFLLFFPPALRLFHNVAPANQVYRYLLIFFPIVIAANLMSGVLQAEMRLKGSALALNTWAQATLVLTVIAYVFMRDQFRAHQVEFVGVIVLGGHVAALVVSGVLVARRRADFPRPEVFRFLFPSGFWKFSATLQLGTMVYFLFENAPQLYITGALGLKENGYFRAALPLAQYVRWLAMIQCQVLYATYCNLAAIPDWRAMRKTYETYITFNSYVSSLAGLVIMGAAPYLLRALGKSFSDQSTFLLILLGIGMLGYPINAGAQMLMNADRRVALNLATNTAGTVVQFLLVFLLLPKMGAGAAALGFSAAFIGVAGASAAIVRKLYGVGVPVVPTLLCVGTEVVIVATRFLLSGHGLLVLVPPFVASLGVLWLAWKRRILELRKPENWGVWTTSPEAGIEEPPALGPATG